MDIQKSTAKRFYTMGKRAALDGDFSSADRQVKNLNRHSAWWHARALCTFIHRLIEEDQKYLSRYQGRFCA